MKDIQKSLNEVGAEVNLTLDHILKTPDQPRVKLIDAMRYSVLDGGKRIRPFLVLASASLFSVDRRYALRVASAIEMVHCYSLIHDDLPAMDDDYMRRGQPTCHVKYDEATAILSGDALLTLAFEVLADEETNEDPEVRSNLVLALAQAAGTEGMVGGQMLDLISEKKDLKMSDIASLQNMKTGKLIQVSCEAGAILGKSSLRDRLALIAFGKDLGLAFQIADDLLDHEGDEKNMGKKTGKDKEAGKATMVSLLGANKARIHAKNLVANACEQLNVFGRKADLLADVAQFAIKRDT